MRIGYISSFPPIECGIATYTEALNHAVHAMNNETFVISQFGAQGEKVFPAFLPESTSFAADVYFTGSKMTPDVIHLQHEYGLYGTQKGVEVVELLLRFKLAGVPVVVTLHTVNDDMDEQEQIILRYIIDGSSAIIVHEQFQRDVLIKLFGSSNKYKVIEHGIREMGPVPGAKERLDMQGKKIILLIGYIRPSKNFHKMVEILPEIVSREKDAILLVAGKSRNSAFDAYKKYFHELIRSSAVSDKIKIFRGQFPQYTFDTILSAADVVVLPYERGGQSGILSQCIAMHKPVVTSNLPAFRNIIKRSGAGLACEKDNQYAETIVKLLNDKELRQKAVEKMQKYITETAGWKKIAEKHLEVYSEVASDPLSRAQYVYLSEPAGYSRY